MPGANSSGAYAINNVGDIVGYFCPTTTCTNSFYLAGSQGYVLSKGVFSAVTIPGAAGTIVIGISDAGVIMGEYFDSAGNSHGFIGIPQ